ncbi:hypothetical protein AX774_g469 [Zancudomyces culisetae]|uniref:Uncharacterized protein n=1 Tax=Zancudomyces culisetae TaxID=1213189 RepID=A0A1R1PYC9_ZANCU|nr:hypothetical protein AX774_g469 [Zancudomyces culisetae]|eukprot:OMH85960.1 hypothetical protein AX774_g469 [Zancudomyces culisetae]
MNSDVSSNGSEKFLKMVEKSVDEIFEILNTKYGRETVTYDENSTVTVLDNTTKSGFLARYPLKRILIQIGGFYHFESTNTLLKSWAENPLATYGKKCSQSKNVDPTNSHGSLVVGKDNNVFPGKSAGGTGGTSDVLASSATSESNSGKNEGETLECQK